MNPLVLLAKSAVENYVKEGKVISPPEEFSCGELAEPLKRKAGTFVTIEREGKLRGCIGTYLPTKENIAEEIIHNAIAAATEDYRFGPIQKEELPFLSYTVYILNPPELVKDIKPFASLSVIAQQLSKELNPKKYGIIVKTGMKSGLLLPDLEEVDTIEQQIAIACQKGGIDPNREKIFIYKFTVEKHQ